ncbi:hypothetical protein F2P81_024356 [Scophthalmus maximus]|uniref:MAM domain-containing protein n=1 Tax=Scophthalmus maximus TaxID=52904 RepID=A0A6A4RMH9_SCOMX|nr:hypothetical protein F2P81_024356 [Scophthalmus maximus]
MDTLLRECLGLLLLLSAGCAQMPTGAIGSVHRFGNSPMADSASPSVSESFPILLPDVDLLWSRIRRPVEALSGNTLAAIRGNYRPFMENVYGKVVIKAPVPRCAADRPFSFAAVQAEVRTSSVRFSLDSEMPTQGSCTFDEGFTQCDYQQDPYDDFDWTHINTQDVPYVSPDLPHGNDRLLSSFLCPPLIEKAFSSASSRHLLAVGESAFSTVFYAFILIFRPILEGDTTSLHQIVSEKVS